MGDIILSQWLKSHACRYVEQSLKMKKVLQNILVMNNLIPLCGWRLGKLQVLHSLKTEKAKSKYHLLQE